MGLNRSSGYAFGNALVRPHKLQLVAIAVVALVAVLVVVTPAEASTARLAIAYNDSRFMGVAYQAAQGEKNNVATSELTVGGTKWLRLTDQPVSATGNQTKRQGIDGSEIDSYSNIELLQLSDGDDNFQSPASGISMSIRALGGDDQIDLTGNRSPSWHDSVDCDSGEDKASIDVNRPYNSGQLELIGDHVEIMEDGASDCEVIDYRPR